MADYDPTLRDTLEYGWLRGPAVVEGDSIVMPVSTAEKYDPLACQDSIGLALAAVPARFLRDELHHPGIEIERTLAFVAKFGPLSDAWPRKVGSSRVIKVSLRTHIDTAWELCFVLDTATEVRKSAAGDRHALRHLWESTGKAVTAPRGRAMVEFLREKTKEAAATADSALPFCVLGLGGHPTDPGRFEFQYDPSDLEALCYLDIARRLVARESIAECADPLCLTFFLQHDARQRYCTKQCAQRVRYHRWANRHSLR